MKKICKILNALLFLASWSWPKVKFVILMLAAFALCQFAALAQAEDWWKTPLLTPEGESQRLSSLVAENGIILLFMDPDCPVTQKYGSTIRELHQTYEEEGMAIAAVYPVVNADPEKIRGFAVDYQFPFTHLLDPKLEFTKAIGASITPEVFLLNTEGGILYQGAIDNWFYELGRYRRVITKHYLKNALEAHLAGRPVPTEKTKAVGCMIGTGMLNHSDHH